MRPVRYFSASAVLLAAVLLAPGLRAQTAQTGVIEGRVTASDGAPVPLAAVTSALVDGSYPREVATDAEGSFRIGFLPPGRYDLKVEALGHRPVELRGIRVRAGQAAKLQIPLEVAPLSLETITVTAAPEIIDRTTTEFSSRLGKEAIELLPAPRSVTALIGFTPGARPDQVWGGSTAQANSYQIDGVGVNQPGYGGNFLLPNVDWIEEVSIRGLGAGAEYGNFQGGLINIVTKSGTNTYRGSGRVDFEHRSFNASRGVEEANLLGGELDMRREVSADFGGPILRDKLYFYLSASQLRRDTRIVDRATSTGDRLDYLPLLNEREDQKGLGKLTWQATERDILNVSLGWDAVFVERQGLSAFRSPEAASRSESPAIFYNASWQRAWNPENLLEVKVTGYGGRDDILPYGGDLPAIQTMFGAPERWQYQNALSTGRSSPTSLAVSASWDSYRKTGGVSHHLKVGGEYTLGWWKERYTRNGGFTWLPYTDLPVDPADPSTWGEAIFGLWGGEMKLVTRTTNAAAYVQDYIQVTPRLSLATGLRLGFWQGYITPGFPPEELFGGGRRSEFKPVQALGIDPRLGAIFDLTGHNGLVAKAHWGRYHQSLFALMYDRVRDGNVFTDAEYWQWIGPGLPDPRHRYTEQERQQLFQLAAAFPVSTEVGPIEDYGQPFVDQWVLGLEKTIRDSWKAEAVYVNRQNRNIISLVDRNRARNYTTYESVEVIDAVTGLPVTGVDGKPLVLPRLHISNADISRLGSAPGLTDSNARALAFEQDLVLTGVPEAERVFDQLQLSVSGPVFSWQARASLVWTDWRGNFLGVDGYDDVVAFGSGAYVHPNQLINARGRMPNYSDREAKVQLAGSLPWGFRSGAFFTFRTGDHYTPLYVIDARSHSFFTSAGEWIDPELLSSIEFQPIYLEARGSRTLPSLKILNLHLDRVLDIRGRQLILGADAFNVLNDNAVAWVNTVVNGQDPSDPTTLFGAPLLRVDPRELRLTTSVRF